MSQTNPFLPEQYLNHHHVHNITREALQDWIQRKKTPYTVEGKRGEIEVKDTDLFRMQAIMSLLIRENADKIDQWMKNENKGSEEG